MGDDRTAEQFGVFDFGLSVEEEERAARLHRDAIIVDLLYAGPCGYRSFTPEMEEEFLPTWEHKHDFWRTYTESAFQPVRAALRGEFPEFKTLWDESGVTGGNRESILDWVEAPLEMILSWTAIAVAQFDQFDWMIKAVRATDFRRAKGEGKHAGFITTQHADALWRQHGLLQADVLQIAHDIGFRMIQLTYNTMNFVGSGCLERSDAGLSYVGLDVVDRMNGLGIIVDVAHCGPRTTLDACAASKMPVVASHTAAEAVFPVQRAKSDEELRAIADTNGLIGICTVPYFIGPPGATIDSVLDHIDHVAQTVGAAHVAIGTDWPLQMSKSVLREMFGPFEAQVLHTRGASKPYEFDSETNLVGFDDYRDFPNFTRGLVKRGYSDDDIRGILGENFLRVFATVCGD